MTFRENQQKDRKPTSREKLSSDRSQSTHFRTVDRPPNRRHTSGPVDPPVVRATLRMCESRAVPSGKVYRQLFDAQVLLSRSLLAGRKDTRLDCLSAEDTAHCSTTSRVQQVGDDDVSGLHDSVVVSQPSSDIIERLTEKKRRKHRVTLTQLDSELTRLSQRCETQVRTVSLELLSSLQEVDLRLNTLKDKIKHLGHVSPQEVCTLWEEVEQQVKLKEVRITELKHKLSDCESRRSELIRVVLRKYCHLLEKVGLLPPSDICRLIHAEATMLNQSLLANRRSAAHLLLLLQEENLLQESLLRLLWEDSLSRWRRSQVNEIIKRFRKFCCSDEDQQLFSDQPRLQEMKQTVRDLTGRRHDLVYDICSLVPPSCTPALVSDWFTQLTAVNQQIENLHADLLHQLRCCYEQTWQDQLAELVRCEEALSALQLSEEEVHDVVSSEFLSLTGQIQSQDEEKLAALDVRCDSAARLALSLSRSVFVVMRGAALLWETHSCRLGRREEEVQQQLDELRGSQQHHIQKKKVHLDDLLGGLRQESSEDSLKTSLDRAVHYLEDVKHSCRQCVSDQYQLLDRHPIVSLEDLLSYSHSLSSFYHLKHTYRPSPEDMQKLYPSSSVPTDPGEMIEGTKIQRENHPISCQNDTQSSQDWLTEAESCLLDFCDITNYVTFTSSRGVACSGPAFRCPVPNLQQETHLCQFPVELLPHVLSRTRTLFLEHLEQHFHDVLSLAVATVTERKAAVCLEQELQLQQLNADHIQTHIYQPRLAELQLHRHRIDVHCEEVLHALTSCREELQELQASISRKNQEFTVTVSNMEDSVLPPYCSRRLQAVSSTLQDCLDEHIKDTQRSQTSFRQTVQRRLEEVRSRTAQLLVSFRLFSEGGDFAPREVKLFQRRLREEAKQISVTEQMVYADLDRFESRSLQQVKETSGRLEEKLSLLKLEVKFSEKIQKLISSTEVHIKSEAVYSNQQQSVIRSRFEDLRRMMQKTEVSPYQVCSFLSSLNEDLRQRCHYLDFSLDAMLTLSAHPTSKKEVQSALPPGLLQPSRTSVDLLEDPVVGVIKSLNRFCSIHDSVSAESEQRGRTAAGQSVRTMSVRRGCRSIKTDRRFQGFGPEPGPDGGTHSFSVTVTSVLRRANNILLLVAEDFYRSERCGLGRFHLLPDSLEQWADSMQQRLMGYQEQARTFLSTSRDELLQQLSVLEELLRSLPAVLIHNHEQQWEAQLKQEVGRVRQRLEETLAASEREKGENVRQLRASLTVIEFQTLSSREELRQQQLHDAICCTHLELQECVRVRREEFVTSLTTMTENLLSQLDDLLTPAETKVVASLQHCEDSTVTMETGAEKVQKPCTVNRTQSDPPSNTTRYTLGHHSVIEKRDAAVKRFEQLLCSESTHSDEDRRRHLSDAQSWNKHWRQQIHILTHMHHT